MALEGLIAAPHTPMGPGGEVRLETVDRQAARLAAAGVRGAFVAGSTGESHSLTMDERRALAERWARSGRERGLKVIVHVGHNAQPDARALAAHAAGLGVDAIAALAPSYFKPASADALVDFLAPVAAAAPDLPFYYYDIPALSGVSLPAPDFLRRGRARIPNLAGVKFTSSDLVQLQECLRLEGGAFDVLFGMDECLLAALALGVRGAVGSTYNFAPAIYLRIFRAFAAGDLETARAEQAKSVRLIRLLSRHGYMGAAKALMGLLGLDCGPVRPPLRALAAPEIAELRRELEEEGLFAELTRAVS